MMRSRTGENRPEERNNLGAPLSIVQRAHRACPQRRWRGAAACVRCCSRISPNRLGFLHVAHAEWRRDSTEPSFARQRPLSVTALFHTSFRVNEWGKRHPRDGCHGMQVMRHPIFADLPEVMTDDAACCVAAVTFVCEAKADAYCLTTHPGHHASAEHYGGYCFLNHAAAARLLEARGKTPFIVDVDYHAGDGIASFGFASNRFVSLHAKGDYPYCPRDEPWAIPAERRDVVDGDESPCARRCVDATPPVTSLSSRLGLIRWQATRMRGPAAALVPDDLGECAPSLPSARCHSSRREGGYHMEDIPAAAEHFGCSSAHDSA